MFKSFTKSTLSAALACLATLAQAGEIRSLTMDDLPPTFLDENEFSFVSFYKSSDPDSVAIDDFVKGAKAIIDKKIADGEWHERDLGWFRVDLDEHPDLSVDGSGRSDQMITGKGNRRMIGYEKVFDETEKNENLMAAIIKELTGDWVEEIECSKIQSQKRAFFDEVIYFGPKKDLEKGGSAEMMNDLSMMDKYNFNEQRVGFYFNGDPECRKEFNLDPLKKYVGFYNGESEPNILTLSKDKVGMQQMLFTLQTSIVKGTPRWGQRAYSSLYDFNNNAVVYYMKDAGNMEEIRKDWRVMLMVEINKWMQHNPSLFVPIVWSSNNDESKQLLVPQLKKVLDLADDEELPHLFVYHPQSDTTLRYPEKLTDPKLVDPTLIMLWAQSQVHKTEIELLGKRLEDHAADPENEETKLTEEQVTKINEHLDIIRPEFEEIKEAHLKHKAALQDKNTFADYVTAALELEKTEGQTEQPTPTEDL